MYVAIDIETTGLDIVSDQIIEIGAVKFDESGIAEEFSTFVNPNIRIPSEVTRLTGITQEDIYSAPQVYEASETLKKFIGNLPLIVHHADFDIEMLKRRICDLENPYYDTLILSQTFIKNMRSYSLESLAKNLNLTHDQKHRALSDAKATAALFLLILNEIKNIDTPEFKKISAVLKKSDWYGKNLFPETKTTAKTAPKKSMSRIITPAPNTEIQTPTFASEKILSALKQDKKTSFELSPCIDAEKTALAAASEFSKISNEQAVAEGNTGHIKKSVCIALRDPKNPILLDKSQYFSGARFEKFLEKEHFDDKEAAFAIKIILHEKDFEKGLKQEVYLAREENSLWSKISCDDFECPHNSGCFYAINRDRMNKEKVWIVSHSMLLNEPEKFDRLILCDADDLMQSANFALSIALYSSRLKNLIDNETLAIKTEVLFGLLWSLVEESSDKETGTYAEMKIEPLQKTTRIWQQIKGTALFMEEIIAKEKPNKFLQNLALLIDIILDKNTNYEMIVHRIYNEEIKVVLTPKNLEELVDKKVFAAHKNIILIGTEMADERVKSDSTPAEIFYIFEDFKNKNREGLFNASVNLIETAITKNNGKTLCIFLSKVALRGTFDALYEKMKSRGINLYGQEVSGGRGKIIDNYIRNPENSSLFILEHYFRQINLAELDFDQIILTKFYTGYGKPTGEIVHDIKKIFNKILAYGKAKHVLITDPHIIPLLPQIASSMVDKIDMRITKTSQLIF